MNIQFLLGYIDPFSCYKELNANSILPSLKIKNKNNREINIRPNNIIAKNLSYNNFKKSELLKFTLLYVDIYPSSMVIDMLNRKILKPYKIYYLQYKKEDRSIKNMLISEKEYLNFVSRFNLFKKYYANNINTRNLPSNNKNANIFNYFDKMNREKLANLFLRFKIYDATGIQVYPELNLETNYNKVNKSFIDLLYLIIFYKKFNAHYIYLLLSNIEDKESKKEVYDLIVNMEKFYLKPNQSFDISQIENLEELENDDKLLKFLNFYGFELQGKNIRENILTYIKSGFFNLNQN